ncbi:hypothetical protein Taro_016075 [Colocasia esculenta]|uniref:Uncharacterized protein n=1 Tax=Colocasia esculenta TaxID=4460 RepID=A0A843URW3_COLES|nr:hypothetical protein [Colocasia esculenta]
MVLLGRFFWGFYGGFYGFPASSNFGLRLVMATKDKLVKADEVLTAESQSHLSMETSVITLAHLALYSDKVELEVVFMICAVAAISPDHRKLCPSGGSALKHTHVFTKYMFIRVYFMGRLCPYADSAPK